MRLKKIIVIISYTILITAFLCFYGYLVKYVSNRNDNSFFSKSLKNFISFPELVSNVFKEIIAPEELLEVDKNFKVIKKLNYNLYALNSHYKVSEHVWVIQLMNLKNDSVIHKWYLKENNFHRTYQILFSHCRPLSSILIKDRSVITMFSWTNNLYKLDKESNIVWHNTEKLFHHAMNLADDGNIWVCSAGSSYVQMPQNDVIKYNDDCITKIDINSGKILYNKSVTEILIENGYPNLVIGITNSYNDRTTDDDPVHLNDIEPVLYDGKYWKKGDLFLSLRNRSLVLLYRPATNKILRLIQGPFISQHDIDILSENQISIFSNNSSFMGFNISSGNDTINSKKTLELNTSEVLVYNFVDSSYHSYLKKQFELEKIYSFSEGIHSIISNGDIFIESSNCGKIYLLNEHGTILRGYANPVEKGHTQLANWTRIYENINF